MMREREGGRIQPAPGRSLSALCASLLPVLALICLFCGVQRVAADDSLCVNCHSDKARLESLSPNRAARLYVDPVKRAEDIHGAFECTVCHGGNPALDSTDACVGVAHPDPSAPEFVQETCGACHQDISKRYLSSIHNTVNGIHTSLQDLLGAEEGTARFQETCNKCHASCSDCHLSTPDRRGLLWPRVETHDFVQKPASDVCWACHGAAGDTFFGEPGNETEHGPSVMAQAGMVCTDCHTDRDVHGTGTETLFVAEAPKPTCEQCHADPTYRWSTDPEAPAAPQYDAQTVAHAIHDEDALSCEACHTEWYPSCWHCHEARADKTVYDVFLARSPTTGKIHPAAHSPASGPDWGSVPAEVGGEWAIKSRHSWGDAQTCEACHTNRDIWINEADRRSPFLGIGRTNRENATFVDLALVDLLVIDPETMKQDVHSDATCAGCHQKVDDAPCAECHATAEKTGQTVLPAGADWSRGPYLKAQQSQDEVQALLKALQGAGVDVAAWQASSDALRQEYLAVSHAFHSAAGPAQGDMATIADRYEALRSTLAQQTQALETQRRRLLVGLPLVIGALGSVTVGAVVYLPKRKKEVVGQ